MSWTSRIGSLGRFSPFTRSAPGAKVSDSDFSYITADDLRKIQEDTNKEQQARQGMSESPTDYGPDRDTDVLILRHKRNGREYAVHFAAYGIAKGETLVKDVREKAAGKINTETKRVKLVYKGKTLKDDNRSCKQEGLRDGSELLLSIYERDDNDASSSDSGDEEADDAQTGAGEDRQRRKRNRGNKSKRKNRRDTARDANSGTSTPEQYKNSNLGVPLSQTSTRNGPQPTSRTASPKPPATPATPIDKLNALHATLGSFKSDVDNFLRHPPDDPSKRDFEHKKLSETILTQVLLKLDAVETEGDADARQRRKDLVKETQGVLNELDAAMKK